MQELKVAIIGAGPAGMTAGIYLSRAQMKPEIFTGFNLGGQLMYTQDLENFPGFPKGVKGPEFMRNLQQQAERFGTVFRHEFVTAVDFSEQPFKLWVKFPEGMDPMKFKDLRGKERELAVEQIKTLEPDYIAKAVIVATGANAVMPGVPGEKEFLGRGVSICAVCDAAFYKDKKVFVIGGGDTAMGDALALAKFTDQVTVIHRRDEFRASKIMQERLLKNSNIKVMWKTQVKAIRGEDGKVSSIVIDRDGQEETLAADGVFLAIGHRPASGLVINELEVDNHGHILSPKHQSKEGLDLANKQLDGNGLIVYPTMSSVEGVFTAGDVADLKYRQASVAAGMGTQAALDVEHWLDEQE